MTKPKYENVPFHKIKSGNLDSTAINFGPRGLLVVSADPAHLPYFLVRSYQHYVQGGRLFRETAPVTYYVCELLDGDLDSKGHFTVLKEAEGGHYFRRLVASLLRDIKRLKKNTENENVQAPG